MHKNYKILYSIIMTTLVIIIILLNRKKPANNNEIDQATQLRLNKIDNTLAPLPAEIQSISNQLSPVPGELKRLDAEIRKLSETESCAILRNLDGTIYSEQPPGCSKLPWMKK
jgi:peptidoglycan hydrolase CwlO-like protein